MHDFYHFEETLNARVETDAKLNSEIHFQKEVFLLEQFWAILPQKFHKKVVIL
jgi:hypothetical protein